MTVLYKNGSISVRKMEDRPEDYALMVKWLSNPAVYKYYGGKPFDLEKVKAKFAHRARGEDRVIPCIILYDGSDCDTIGYLQFYPINSGDYNESEILDMSGFHNPYGIDIVIGETPCWGKGIGTEIMRMTVRYLFGEINADIIFIDPHTWNKRAIKCYEKSGFIPLKVLEKRELHNDEYSDSLIMCIARDNRSVRRL